MQVCKITWAADEIFRNSVERRGPHLVGSPLGLHFPTSRILADRLAPLFEADPETITFRLIPSRLPPLGTMCVDFAADCTSPLVRYLATRIGHSGNDDEVVPFVDPVAVGASLKDLSTQDWSAIADRADFSPFEYTVDATALRRALHFVGIGELRLFVAPNGTELTMRTENRAANSERCMTIKLLFVDTARPLAPLTDSRQVDLVLDGELLAPSSSWLSKVPIADARYFCLKVGSGVSWTRLEVTTNDDGVIEIDVDEVASMREKSCRTEFLPKSALRIVAKMADLAVQRAWVMSFTRCGANQVACHLGPSFRDAALLIIDLL